MEWFMSWVRILRGHCRLKMVIPLTGLSVFLVCVVLCVCLWTPNPISPLPLYLDTNLDIFDLLKRWGDVNSSFLERDTPVLHLPPSCLPTPIPRYCSKAAAHGEPVVECESRTPHELTPFEENGNHIMFTLRTTAKFHRPRLPILFQTWLATVNRSNVFIVTDRYDKVLQRRCSEAGIHYKVSVSGYDRLCDKAGDEIVLMFQPQNRHYEWFCHVDDDIYVNVDMLVQALAKFPRQDPIYFGRSGSDWLKPRRVRFEAKIGKRNEKYHFAVGGMYCLNRVMLEKAKEWIGNKTVFGKSCRLTREPEDVTVGLAIGILLKQKLQRTRQIFTHGLDLYATVVPETLRYQVAFAYGFGALKYKVREHNVINVPHNLFGMTEDISQFLSLHCHLHPEVGWCIHRQKQLALTLSS